jgi:hypothetical protein
MPYLFLSLFISLVFISCTDPVKPLDEDPNAPNPPGSVITPPISSSSSDTEPPVSSSDISDLPEPFLDFDYAAQQNATGLLVYLHGDGAEEYDNMFNDLTLYSRSLGFAHLQTRAPDSLMLEDNITGITEMTASWRAEPLRNTARLDSLITYVLSLPSAREIQNVYFTGASGGAVFITRDFLPRYGAKYTGGAILLCGGMQPDLIPNFESDWIPHFFLDFYTQQQDIIYNEALVAANYYTSLGFSTDPDFPPGGSHCGFDVGEVLQLKLNAHL